MLLLTTALLIIVTIGIFFKFKFSYFKQRGIFHLKPKFPFGSFAGLGTKLHFMDIVIDYYNKCKGKDVMVGFFSSFIPIYVIMDLETVKNVLIKDFNNFCHRGFYHNEENEPLTANLTALVGEKWKFIRRKLNPAFTTAKARLMFDIFQSKMSVLVDTLSRKIINNDSSVDMADMGFKLFLDIFGSISFGLETNTLNGENTDLVYYSQESYDAEGPGIVKYFFFFFMPKFSKYLKLRFFSKKLSCYYTKIMTDSIKYREDNNVKKKDLLDMLIQLKNKGTIDDEQSAEDEKITLDQCIVFYFFNHCSSHV
jgi:cytochrome P450 family 6